MQPIAAPRSCSGKLVKVIWVWGGKGRCGVEGCLVGERMETVHPEG